MDEIQKILDEFMDGYIVNIQFVSFYKKKQQVERAFELG